MLPFVKIGKDERWWQWMWPFNLLFIISSCERPLIIHGPSNDLMKVIQSQNHANLFNERNLCFCNRLVWRHTALRLVALPGSPLPSPESPPSLTGSFPYKPILNIYTMTKLNIFLLIPVYHFFANLSTGTLGI